jgi:hypothetical protein
MSELLYASPMLQGVQKSAKEWADLLHNVIPGYDSDLFRKITKSYVGWEIKNVKDLYRSRLNMVEDIDRHTKTKTYAFRLPDEKLVPIKDVA